MFFVVLLVLFFLINDSFLAFVTSSSLLVVGTTQSSRHLLPALPVPEDGWEDPVCLQTRSPVALVHFSPRDVKELKLPLSTELKTTSGFGEDQRYTCLLAAYQLFFLSPPGC